MQSADQIVKDKRTYIDEFDLFDKENISAKKKLKCL